MNMGKVATGLSMSLDGFVAGPNDGPGSPLGGGGERLFAWYSSGDTEYRLPGTEMVFQVSPTPDGHQMPMLNVFHRDGDTIRHFWGSELLYAPTDPGQDPRHNGSQPERVECLGDRR
jgi:hypothetical protein